MTAREFDWPGSVPADPVLALDQQWRDYQREAEQLFDEGLALERTGGRTLRVDEIYRRAEALTREFHDAQERMLATASADLRGVIAKARALQHECVDWELDPRQFDSLISDLERLAGQDGEAAS